MRRPRPHPAADRGATMTVERLAAGGDGVGRVGGKVTFVPLTAPGDVVDIVRVEDRRTFARARLRRILSPSADRVEPACPAFGTCGGCGWQHVRYAAQLDAKRQIVTDALRRIGGIAPPAVGPALPSPATYGYRHRARLHAGRAGGAVAFGFYRTGSTALVPIRVCPVMHRSVEAALDALGLAGSRHAQELARCIEARVDADGEGSRVRLALRGPGGAPLAFPAGAARTVRQRLGDAGVAAFLGDDADAPLSLGPGGDALVTTGEAFTQVNLAQNQRLVAAAVALASPLPGEEALDLYCGLGNLSLPLSAAGARVLGVDLDSPAIRQAEANARRLRSAALFAAGDAAAAVAALARAGRRFPLVVLNPPRAGARETVENLPALAPQRVVVVSCDPATLARDAAVLRRHGYRLDVVQPIDIFPQTAHVETVALFVKED